MTPAPKLVEDEKPRERHYHQFIIRLHTRSQVSLKDLEHVLKTRAEQAGERLTVREEGRHYGTMYIIDPPPARPRLDPAEKARRLALQLREAAEKAGIDPASLLLIAE